MFFRVWWLYGGKAALLAALTWAWAAYKHPQVEHFANIATMGFAAAGACLGIWWFVLRRPVGCPECGGPSELWAVRGIRGGGGVVCDRCGLLYSNPLVDLQFRRLSREEFERRFGPVEESD